DINRPLLIRRERNWRIPVKPELFLVIRSWLNVPSFVRVAIYPSNLTALVFGINVIRVSRVGKHPKPIATVHVFPLRVGDTARVLRIAHPGTIVLQTAVNAVRVVFVDADVIKLRHRQVFAFPPFAPAVVGVPHSAVVSDEYDLGVGGIDPHVVRVSVSSLKTAYYRKTFSAVLADNQ